MLYAVGVKVLLNYLLAERGRMARVAEAVPISGAFLSQIANGGRPVPIEHAAGLERACEYNVMRWDMFPRTWHRIWPELIGTEGAPSIPAQEARDAA